tara:strand:- start:7 stop:447 length:441 start_codon:yes stop_codon:yes gene_type:complete
MALPATITGRERTLTLPLVASATAIPASATNELTLFREERDIDFREIGIISQGTVVSGATASNYMRAELWNFTDATKLAQSTITGIATGTQLQRNVYVSIATKGQFMGPGSRASAQKVFTLKFVGASTLSKNIIGKACVTYDYLRD